MRVPGFSTEHGLATGNQASAWENEVAIFFRPGPNLLLPGSITFSLAGPKFLKIRPGPNLHRLGPNSFGRAIISSTSPGINKATIDLPKNLHTHYLLHERSRPQSVHTQQETGRNDKKGDERSP